ncbi:MAG: acetate--CoA ligase family protein [Rhodospirillaceae bacterium]|jgi:acetate---CoA ligase (ADP-forming)|nr:acetate--CoA ligase family protein [Rhodospirillaceae bacterium]MBT6118635.1 acetate--CoA ligase family protein [Rhodospirillaceae bacterium]
MTKVAEGNLLRLLRPGSVAVVGATPREEASGHVVLRNLLRHGFAGEVYAVNPRYDQVLDRPCYPSLADLPGPIDAAFLAVPAAAVPDLIDQAAAKGAAGVCVNAGGFADAGREGAALQDELSARAATHGMAVCGPNNMGLVNLWDGAVMWMSDLPELAPGPVAVVSQSGSVAIALSQDPRGLGIGYLVTVGNEAVCDVADYLDALAADERVGTVLLFLEALRRPRAFAAAARKAIAAGQRIVALKAGRSAVGRAAVAAHSGALAGEDEVHRAFFRDLGVIQARDLDELLEAAVLATAHLDPPEAHGVGIVTLSGGEAAMIADLAEGAGLDLPQPEGQAKESLRDLLPPITNLSNPLDIWGYGWDAKTFAKALAVLLDDERLGTILCFGDPPLSGGNDMEHVKEMAEVLAAVASGTDKRLALVNNLATVAPHPEIAAVLDAAGLPYLRGTAPALAAVRSWLGFADRREVRNAVPPTAIDPAMTEVEGFDRLRAAGVPTAMSQAAADPAEAKERAAALGYPVAVKGSVPGLSHKTEQGLVRLGLADGAAVEAAAEKIEAAMAALGREGSHLVVQAMAPRGVELYLGVRNDPDFGSLILAGPGGVFVEALDDVSSRMGPVDAAEARAMLAETGAEKLLAGFRGAPPADIEAAAEAIAALSRFGAAVAGVFASVEINPLIVLPKGAVGVDAAFEVHSNRPREGT